MSKKTSVDQVMKKVEKIDPRTDVEKQLASIPQHVKDRFFDEQTRAEEDDNKTESEKRHEKWVRKMKKQSRPMEVVISKAKKIKPKPGLVFEGPLKVLVEKYKDIDTIWKHMTMGQLTKYSVIEGKIYRLYKDDRPNKLVFNPETGEVFDE